MPRIVWPHKLSIADLLASCLTSGLAVAQRAVGEWRLNDSDGATRAGYFDVYVKSLLTCNGSVWASLRLDYGETAKQDFDAALTRMSQSFTPRATADGKPLCE